MEVYGSMKIKVLVECRLNIAIFSHILFSFVRGRIFSRNTPDYFISPEFKNICREQCSTVVKKISCIQMRSNVSYINTLVSSTKIK